jgi:hypothetical protein
MAKTNHLGARALVAGALVAVGYLVLMLVVGEPAGAAFPGENGKPPSPDPSPSDTTAPKVTETAPPWPAMNVRATFSEPMDALSINATTLKLFKKGSTTKIAAEVSYSAATHIATLNPTDSLRPHGTYKAVVTTGAKDMAGNPLDQNSTKPGLQQQRWFFKASSL